MGTGEGAFRNEQRQGDLPEGRIHVGIVYVIPPNNPRVLGTRLIKEVAALGEAGIRTSVLCPQVDAGQPEKERLNSFITVYRKAVPMPSRLERALSSWTLYFPLWRPIIERFVEDHGIDVLHVRDLPMLRTVLTVANRRRVPIVADFYENWPAAQESYRGDRSWYYRMAMSFSRGQFLYRWYERSLVARCERIIVVVPEAAERFVSSGTPEGKIVVVSNTEDDSTLNVPEIDIEGTEFDIFRDRWVAIYHGNAGVHRGLDTVVKAIPAIVERVPNFLFLAVGIDEEWRARLEELARSLKIPSHLQIRGWTPFETCVRYILASRVGLVPHADYEHTRTTVPHKLFQFMLCGRPVVVSDCRPLKRIVRSAEAGAVFRAGDPLSFARTVVELAGDSERCRVFGENGAQAARTTFAWKKDAARLVSMYREIAQAQQRDTTPGRFVEGAFSEEGSQFKGGPER